MPWTNGNQTAFMQKVRLDNPSYEKMFSKIGVSKSDLHGLVDLLARAANGTANPTAQAIRDEVADLKDSKKIKYQRALSYLASNFPDYDVQIVGSLRLKGFIGIVDSEQRKQRAILGMGRILELTQLCNTTMAQVVADSPSSPALGTLKGPTGEAKIAATELYKKWFDVSRRPMYVDKVRSIFSRLAAAVRNESFEIVVYGTPENPGGDGSAGPEVENAFAFVIPSEGSYRIYLAQYFFKEMSARIDVPTVAHAKVAQTVDEWQLEKRTKTAMDAAIITVLHELTHITALGGTTDEPPDPYGLPACKALARNNAQKACNNAENYAQFASALWMQKFFF